PFSGSVRAHHSDEEGPAVDLGKGDQITARRPDRGAVFARTEADPLGLAAIRAHDIKLLGTTAIGIEDDLAAVGRKAGRSIDRLAVGQARGPAAAEIEGEQVADAVLGAAHDDSVAVG